MLPAVPFAKYLVAITISVIFVVLEVVMDGFASNLPRRKGRNGDQRYHLSYVEDQVEKHLMPLGITDLRRHMRGKKGITGVDLLKPRLREVSVGIGLCIAALSGDLINFLAFPLLARPGEYEPILHPLLGLALVFIFLTLVATTSLIREFGSHTEPWLRIGFIQATNLFGLAMMFAVYLFLGELIAQ